MMNANTIPAEIFYNFFKNTSNDGLEHDLYRYISVYSITAEDLLENSSAIYLLYNFVRNRVQVHYEFRSL